MSWRRRSRVFQMFSRLPGGGALLDVARRRVGAIRRFDVGARMDAVEAFSWMLDELGRSVKGATLCEVGAGWHPLVPAVFHGMGAERVVMTDIASYMRGDQVAATVRFLTEHAAEVAAELGCPADELRERWEALAPVDRSWRGQWERYGLEYVAPHDFRRGGLPAESFDVVYSNSVLGYVPVPELEAIFAASTRLLRPGGWVMHRISTYDDYANSDPGITPLNFLSFAPDEWERIGNSRLHYQSRLRPAAYVELARRHGLRILLEERCPEHLRPDMLDRERLHPEFADLPQEELLCANLLLAAEKR